jgi:hypothetical protein
MGFVVGAALIIGGATLASGAISANAARQEGKDNRRAAGRIRDEIAQLEGNRQEIINPFSGMSNLSDMISNPMANLQVATEAAEFQAEEADIALANTLDTLRTTGAGAGGATALAQGALRSKRGIGATIAQQEAANSMARAQGEQSAMTMRINEARRMQAMRAQGQQYMFETQENRDMARLDRLAGLQTGYEQNAANAMSQSNQIWGQTIPNALTAGMSFYNTANAANNPAGGVTNNYYGPTGQSVG